jgi:hypothetical protein
MLYARITETQRLTNFYNTTIQASLTVSGTDYVRHRRHLKATKYCRFQTFAVICILYMFFWVYNQPLKMELTQGSETSANYNYKLTPGKYPKEHIQATKYVTTNHN